MKEEKKLTCIICPVGCSLSVLIEDNNVIKVTGNACKRGLVYAEEETTRPSRTLTTTIRVNGGIDKLVSVKTSKPIPKGLQFEAMKHINSVTVTAPIKIGDVIISNILETGADIVATSRVKSVII